MSDSEAITIVKDDEVQEQESDESGVNDYQEETEPEESGDFEGPAEEVEPEKKQPDKKCLKAYQELVDDVVDMAEMQNHKAYENFMKECRRKIDESQKSLVYIDKPREVIHAQESIKVLKWVIEQFRAPVDRLNLFNTNNPIFIDQVKLVATWDEKSATVNIKEKEE